MKLSKKEEKKRREKFKKSICNTHYLKKKYTD